MERKARGDETPEEKERRREEKRRLKRERKAAECRADVARSSGTRMQSAKALQNGHDASSSNAAAMLVALSNGDHAAPSTVPVENNENQPTQLGSPAVVGIKRPGSVLGGSGSPAIAPSPKLQRISSSHSLERCALLRLSSSSTSRDLSGPLSRRRRSPSPVQAFPLACRSEFSDQMCLPYLRLMVKVSRPRLLRSRPIGTCNNRVVSNDLFHFIHYRYTSFLRPTCR